MPGKKSDRRSVRKMLNFLEALSKLKVSLNYPGMKILAPILDIEYEDVRQELIAGLETHID